MGYLMYELIDFDTKRRNYLRFEYKSINICGLGKDLLGFQTIHAIYTILKNDFKQGNESICLCMNIVNSYLSAKLTKITE